MKKYADKIIKEFEPKKYYTYSEIMKKIGVIPKASGEYYRAWQDLTVSGRLDRGLNSEMGQANIYRINQ